MTGLRALAAAMALAVPSAAMAAQQIIVYGDPGCGCCEQWAAQVRAAFGRKVQMVDNNARSAFARAKGVPADLASCHTAVVDGLVFEGHVPIADMKRLLAQRPKGVAGLAVAGMPLGSPGMEVPGARAQRYEVIAFGPAGRRVFARHGVSIRAAEQEGIGDDARLVFITHDAREADVQATVRELRELDVVRRVGGMLRVVGG